MKTYCLTIYNENFNFFKKLKLIPVGLGNEKFSRKWLNDKNGLNIAKKNSFYGEYTFHYNMWKNNLIKKIDKNWIGFCTYRRFWVKKKKIISTYKELEENILKFVPRQWNGYESILASPIKIKKIKKIKIIKNAFIEIIKNPYLFFKTKQNIKDHFYIFHGSNFLDESIKLLKFNEKKEFINFLNKDSFNPHNLFFCKNIQILKEYYNSLFNWLDLCEKKFGFEGLTGYGKRRIYGFLAERYLCFWFNKYTKSRTWPISYFDTNKLPNLKVF